MARRHRPGAEGTFRSHISTNGPRGEVRVVDASVSNKGRVEAHARYAAGVVNDLRDQPEAADQEFLKAVEADRDNETLAIELADAVPDTTSSMPPRPRSRPCSSSSGSWPAMRWRPTRRAARRACTSRP